jgi:light-regulated signal transduction histidine kinase (bacteriophytochrome)
MNREELMEALKKAEETIRSLQNELKETNRGVIALNLELEQRVEEQEKAEVALQEAMKELESFSYSVSHDLRAPLRAIDGFANILFEEYNNVLDDEGKRLLSVIIKNVNSMGQLIDDLLAFSRLSRQQIQRIEIDVRALVQEVIDDLMASESVRRIEWEVDTLPAMIGDRSMIRQVYVNLLSNALKFTRKRDVARIEVGSRESGGEIVYYISDNGAGFDMQYQEKLFGVFQRLHSEKEFEGTGVGLANVRRIVHRHGGRIWAEGRVGEGATFYFTISTEEVHNGISQ